MIEMGAEEEENDTKVVTGKAVPKTTWTLIKLAVPLFLSSASWVRLKNKS